jgi:hypothetical protein
VSVAKIPDLGWIARGGSLFAATGDPTGCVLYRGLLKWPNAHWWTDFGEKPDNGAATPFVTRFLPKGYSRFAMRPMGSPHWPANGTTNVMALWNSTVVFFDSLRGIRT